MRPKTTVGGGLVVVREGGVKNGKERFSKRNYARGVVQARFCKIGSEKGFMNYLRYPLKPNIMVFLRPILSHK